MIELNRIYQCDCVQFMQSNENIADLVLTSPPYNTSRKGSSLDHLSKPQENIRYDEFNDCRPNEEYYEWTVEVFNGFDKILKPNGCVLYNMSYSSENTEVMYMAVANILQKTNFTIAGDIVWKKSSASPDSCSPNKLTRICEHVFVFCRRSEFSTFKTNKKISSQRKTGQNAYKNIFNFIEAPNNDEACAIHKATYSSMLCRKLLNIYAPKGSIIYDPFIGTGTTAIACIKDGYDFIGTEISQRYVDYANKRIQAEQQQLKLF
jgi:site-specific DNA-methyltransferase (adenine-specific)/modification methylase